MKKSTLPYIFSIISLLFITACSATWEGVKSDSQNAWKSTKETIHEATK